MHTPIIQRIICAAKALLFFMLSIFVYVSAFSHLGQSGWLMLGIMQSPVVVAMGYASLGILAFVAIAFVISLAVGMVSAWRGTARSLHIYFGTALLLWLITMAVMPFTEVLRPLGPSTIPDVTRYLIASILLFGVPTVLTFIVWVALDGRQSLTLLHRAIGSIVAGLLPGIFGVVGMVIDPFYAASFAAGTGIGLMLIPVMLGFTYTCREAHQPPQSSAS